MSIIVDKKATTKTNKQLDKHGVWEGRRARGRGALLNYNMNLLDYFMFFAIFQNVNQADLLLFVT